MRSAASRVAVGKLRETFLEIFKASLHVTRSVRTQGEFDIIIHHTSTGKIESIIMLSNIKRVYSHIKIMFAKNKWNSKS